MRTVWRPGEDVLPPVIPRGDEGMVSAVVRRNPTRASVTSLQRVRPPRSNSDPPPASYEPPQQSPRTSQTSSPTSPRLLSRLLSTSPEDLPTPMHFHLPTRPRPRSPPTRRPIHDQDHRHSTSISTTGGVPTSSVLGILQRGSEAVIITCDGCSRRLDNSVHLECSNCPLFHLCLRCFRAGRTCPSTSHHLTRQRLIASWPRRYLQVGVFCDVCDSWLDEDRNGGARVDAMWWRCDTCNDGKGWSLCTRCVQRGWNCTHELEVWTNSRTSNSPSSGLIRGPRSERAGFFPAPLQPLSSSPREPPTQDELHLHALGYHPWIWMQYSSMCTLCKLPLCPPNTWLHCFACPEDHGDLCSTCFYNLHRTFPSPTRGLHSFYLCPRGHPMSVLAQPGKPVLHRGVFAHAPKPRAPEWIVPAATGALSIASGHSGGGSSGGRAAVAVRGHWPDEAEAGEGEDRKWGRGQWLCFPRGAEVLDVVAAFEQDERESVEWCWGSYAGVGGLFPGACVMFV